MRWFSLRRTRELRRGDLAEVAPAGDILATLDENGSLDGVPFMPEMLAYLGRRLTVEARMERACDTIYGSGTRRMRTRLPIWRRRKGLARSSARSVSFLARSSPISV